MNNNVSGNSSSTPDISIDRARTAQTIEGFGACFNELGWDALQVLPSDDQESIMKELFLKGMGAGFTVCRMPIGANDFSLDWYSYNEVEGDFEMDNFSIENDSKTLIPYIHQALKYNPGLKIWASPWSPPAWMKWNKHYACNPTGDWVAKKHQNYLPESRRGREGTNMFIQ